MNRTKQEISEALWQLLDEKPYGKITVQNIVERCGINRSTFYYHFSDIPAVLEFAVMRWMDEIITQEPSEGFPLNCIRPIAEKCLERKQACLSIYRSVHRDEFLVLLNRVFTHMLNRFADQSLRTDSPERDLLVWYSRCTLSGMILDWFDAGMSYDMPERMSAVCTASRGTAGKIWFNTKK